MNKVVCDLCGTTYPDTASQCPICGTVRSAKTSGNSAKNAEPAETGGYTYVKGGRFSKKNVKKRAESAQRSYHEEAPVPRPQRQTSGTPVKKSVAVKKEEPRKDKVSVGLTITAVILTLAIIAVICFIVMRFFLPVNTPAVPSTTAPATESTDIVDDAPELIGCESVTLNTNTLTFTQVNERQQLLLTLTPADTTDTVQFTSSDAAVVSVADDGTVTAVGKGTAIITVICGSASTQCSVTCSFAPDITLELNRKEITFEMEGQSWKLYDGELDASKIQWSSDNEAVASVSDGLVIALGDGDAVITAEYNGQTVKCTIHCKFKEDPEIGGNNSGESDEKSYRLFNVYGNAKDVTLKVGETFPLQLIDEEGNSVKDAQWKVGNTNVCTFANNWVKAVGKGTTEVTATYNGVNYTCVVRVG